MAAKLDMLVRLMVGGIEDHRNHTAVVNVDGHRGVCFGGIKLAKKLQQPLSFTCSDSQGIVLGVIRASSHVGVKLAIPRQDCRAIGKDISQRASGSVGAIRER